MLRASELLDDPGLAGARAAGPQQLEAAVAKLNCADLKAIITYLDISKMPRRSSAEPDKAAKKEDFLSVAIGLIASEPMATGLDGDSEESSSASDGAHMPALQKKNHLASAAGTCKKIEQKNCTRALACKAETAHTATRAQNIRRDYTLPGVRSRSLQRKICILFHF